MPKTLTDKHYDDCPDCGPPHKVTFFGFDIQKRRVYQCSKCERKFGESVLKIADRQRRALD